MITLRPYQQQALSDISAFFKKGGYHCILQSPTGSGKTIMFTEIARRVAAKGNKVLILTDRAELLQQAGGALSLVNLEAFYIKAGQKYVNNNYSAFVAMSQTFRRRIKKSYWQKFLKSISLIIIDESHKQEFNYLFESGLVDKAHIIGATATPNRSGKMRQMGLDYEQIITTTSVLDLISEGYLVNDDLYTFESPDMHGVQFDRMKGDYKQNQMFEKFNQTKRYAGVVKNYKEICPGTKALCFCVNIEHVIKTTEEFQKAGIDARFVVSGLSKPQRPETGATDGQIARYQEKKRIYELYQQAFIKWSGNRDQLFDDFKRNQFEVLVNAEIATTGFDIPDIETIILNRATTSKTLYLQMLGRGSRPAPGKDSFNILDFGGNAHRLGTYNEQRLWSLWHDEGGGDGLPPTKFCGIRPSGQPVRSDMQGCKRMIHAEYTICPFCGFKYPDKKIDEVDLALAVTGSKDAGHSGIKAKRIKDMTRSELYNYFRTKKHKTAWLWRQLYYRGGRQEIETFGRAYNWRQSTIERALSYVESF